MARNLPKVRAAPAELTSRVKPSSRTARALPPWLHDTRRHRTRSPKHTRALANRVCLALRAGIGGVASDRRALGAHAASRARERRQLVRATIWSPGRRGRHL